LPPAGSFLLLSPAAYFLPISFLSPTAYFLPTAAKSMQKMPPETHGFWTSFTFKSFVRYGPSRELAQQ
jgi:hypothetical protein